MVVSKVSDLGFQLRCAIYSIGVGVIISLDQGIYSIRRYMQKLGGSEYCIDALIFFYHFAIFICMTIKEFP